mmetsp:Transcript_13771/g.39166  ORF Transcript_13771/g.39166 Transcript_13771/m.39166 type:complete len:1111 (+) Transcript_13771:148-3480(+)
MAKRILKIYIDESHTLKQLGLAKMFKSCVATPETTALELEMTLVKMLSKGLTSEQKELLEGDVSEFQLAERVDGKIVRRFEPHEKPLEGLDPKQPITLMFAAKKQKRLLKAKATSAAVINKAQRKNRMSRKVAASPRTPTKGASMPALVSTTTTPKPKPVIPGEKSPRGDEKPCDEMRYINTVLHMIFESLGMDQERNEAMIRSVMSSASHSPAWPPPPWVICECLENVKSSVIEPALLSMGDIQKIVIAQRYIRVFVAQNRLRRYKRDFLPGPDGVLPPLGRRLHLMRAFYKEGVDFRDKIYVFFSKVERPLKKIASDGADWISKDESDILFRDNSVFRTFFTRFLKRMNKLRDGWPALSWTDLGKLFDKGFNDGAELFTLFSLRHQEVVNTIERLQARPDFASFMGEVMSTASSNEDSPGGSSFPGVRQRGEGGSGILQRQGSRSMRGSVLLSKGLNLKQMVFAPYDRLGDYARFLQEVIGLTQSATEATALQRGLDNITALQAKVEENKVKSKDNLRMNEVQRKLDSIMAVDTAKYSWLPKEDRSFVAEGGITQITHDKEKDKWKSHENHLMIFSDLLVVCLRLEKEKVDKSLVAEDSGTIMFCQVKLEDRVNVGDPKYPPDCTFRLNVETGKDTRDELVFCCKSPAEKMYWFDKLETRAKANRVCFGRPVADVVKHDKTPIPRIVCGTLSELVRKEAAKLEGIFRIAGETKYLVHMKGMYDRWEKDKPEVDLSSYDSFDIAALLKQWFRELPEPIMTYSVYDKYMQNDDEIDYQVLLDELPPLNRDIILYVFSFCVELTRHSEENKMTPANVAICWGPTILRPKVDDIQSSMRIPRVNKSVEDFVKWLSERPEMLPTVEVLSPDGKDKTAKAAAPSGNAGWQSMRQSNDGKLKRWTSIQMGKTGGQPGTPPPGNPPPGLPPPIAPLPPAISGFGGGGGPLSARRSQMVPSDLPPPPPATGRGQNDVSPRFHAGMRSVSCMVPRQPRPVSAIIPGGSRSPTTGQRPGLRPMGGSAQQRSPGQSTQRTPRGRNLSSGPAGGGGQDALIAALKNRNQKTLSSPKTAPPARPTAPAPAPDDSGPPPRPAAAAPSIREAPSRPTAPAPPVE